MGQLKNQRKKIKNQCQKGKMGKVQGLVCRRSLTVSVEYFNWEEQMLVLFCFCIILLKMQITGTMLCLKVPSSHLQGGAGDFCQDWFKLGAKQNTEANSQYYHQKKKGELMLANKTNKTLIKQTENRCLLHNTPLDVVGLLHYLACVLRTRTLLDIYYANRVPERRREP